jgi:hypothetical protein
VHRSKVALVVAALALVGAAGCSEPEPSSYALTVSSMGGGQMCGVGPDTDELCWPDEAFDPSSGGGAHLDDCVTAQVDRTDGLRVSHAIWRGRCASEPVALGFASEGGERIVLVPPCLGSLTSLRVEDDDGDVVWSVARNGSAEHPLLDRVVLGEVPPGFVEHDEWSGVEQGTELSVRAQQQFGNLPAGEVSFPEASTSRLVPTGCKSS